MKKKLVGIIISMLLFITVVSVAGLSKSTEREVKTVTTMSTDWWSQFHHDVAHTGFSTSVAPNTNNFAWSFATGNSVTSSPAVVDGKLYVGSNNGKIYCLDAIIGNQIWNFTISSMFTQCSPVVADGKVYIGSYDKFYCLNAITGSPLWNYTMSGSESSPTVVNGKVYVGALDKKVYCLNTTNGALVWQYTTGNFIRSSPAVDNNKVYIGSYDKRVYCLNAKTGGLIWSYLTGDLVFSSPAVINGNVYVGSNDKKVYCLNAGNGSVIWSYTTGGQVQSSPAVTNGKIFVASLDKKVYCLNATTGASIWSHLFNTASSSSPAVADGKIYLGFNDMNVTCLNADTGAIIWSYKTGGIVQSSPAIADSRLFVGSSDGKVYSVRDNSAPNPPDKPTPETDGDAGLIYFFQTKAVDPDGDQLKYGWDWGDGSQIQWTSFYDSNVTVEMNHTWIKGGIYQIKVKASDGKTESGWSEPLQVTMRQAVLAIGNITSTIGGNRINVQIINTGDAKAWNVEWNITISGGFLVFVPKENGTISSLVPGETKVVALYGKPLLGIGIGLGILKPQPVITVNATCPGTGISPAEKSVEAKMFFHIVIIR